MRRLAPLFGFMWIGVLLLATSIEAAQPGLPVINGQPAVAAVNNEPITLKELKRAIAAAHTDRAENVKAGRIDYTDIMNRLINTRLIVLEARNMGLDQLPEIRDTLAEFHRQTLMKVLIEQVVDAVAAEEDEVNRIYEDLVREWKISSILFKKQEDVERAREAIESGEDFNAVAEQYEASGRAEMSEEAEYLKNKDLTPTVARIVAGMKVGTISPIVSVGRKGYIIFRLEGSRIPAEEFPEERKKARRIARQESRVQAAKYYYSSLREKYVRVNQQLLTELDYESEAPGLNKLLKDKRVLAEIRGEKPITVAELSAAMEKHYYHGIERAIRQKEVNAKKEKILEDILQDRILVKDALRQDVDKTDLFKARVKQYEYSTIFGAFVNRVVRPEIQVSEDELESYYRDNLETFTTPEMIKVKSLAFDDRAMAIDALEKLNNGTDFNWMSTQVQDRSPTSAAKSLGIDGKLITVRSMPEELRKSLSDVKPGDYRFYGSPGGPFYVLHVYYVVAPQPRPFAEVRKDIAEEIYNSKVKQTVESWANKLKEYYPVKIYLSDMSNLTD